MRKKMIIILLFLSMVTQGILFAAPWWGGYRVAFDGYAVDAIATSEHLSFDLNITPFPNLSYSPSVQAGLAMSAGEHLLATLGADIPLFKLHTHPFQSFFRRTSAYTPTLGLATIFDLNTEELVAAVLTLQPLMFDFSDKQVGILGFHAVWDIKTESWGWGLRLFEISHYLW
ncbi:MAG: hypothetical protein WCS59_04955 [Sphaerochaetaceae bacterium]|jgi:hypothetical protein